MFRLTPSATDSERSDGSLIPAGQLAGDDQGAEPIGQLAVQRTGGKIQSPINRTNR